ncbi:hypothetical protein CONPUDRAFT_157234 [Coniophora puteana RWD-64-598 SS2]|uniref:CxC2-like cysteine cluster KDZ transposase-associated domain-containing protein n=1 Tax=Coniophora puteana (strain RWD-64-598) TaxID=741705 RepID=A0A5M3MFS8_CONPW|nr:uncharacterized protein CONPUDRAFT_157234 [Coniophora puteana RWD-64-598 SS2]EIW78072.1 hypothetical protein CONPUDRAFT_157234 [Coniophora puteana RWD-64-598 SS2]
MESDSRPNKRARVFEPDPADPGQVENVVYMKPVKKRGKSTLKPKVQKEATTSQHTPATQRSPPPPLSLQPQPTVPSPFFSDAAANFDDDSTPKSNQDRFMRDWIPHEHKYLQEIITLDGAQKAATCSRCGTGAVTWRCLSCLGVPEGCKACISQTHSRLPFHELEEWREDHWSSSAAKDLGIVLFMGHNGLKCPCAGVSGVSGVFEAKDGDQGLDAGNGDGGADDKQRAEADRKRPKTVWLTVVDISGVHRLPALWCTCPDSPPRDLQLLRMRLYPASTQQPRTAFTFAALHDFMISNLEMKVPANAYFRKLRYVTNEMMPDDVPDRYRELARCYRQWIRLRTRQAHGHGYNQPAEEQAVGSMAHFCVACPQPGRNLAPDWKTSGPAWLYYRQLVIDGNFKQVNVPMRNQENDVQLADGMSYTVNQVQYEAHLASTTDKPMRSSCNDHRAVSLSNRRKKNLRVTGLVAVACARHGCFLPNTVVDLKLGEKQSVVDFAISMAGMSDEELLGFIFIYDIICQYFIHFRRRFGHYPHIAFPEHVDVVPAIGLFHVHGHKDECVARYSPNYIRGMGNIDGEVLETLWAVLNAIANSFRNMSASGRKDLMNAQMRWSNLRKMLTCVELTIKRWHTALKHFASAQREFAKFRNVCQPKDVAEWSKKIEAAYMIRDGSKEKDKIFNVKVGKLAGRLAISETLQPPARRSESARGVIAWLLLGIDIEELQIRILALVRVAGKRSRRSDTTTLERERRHLNELMADFERDAPLYMNALLITNPKHVVLTQIFEGDHEDLVPEEGPHDTCPTNSAPGVDSEEDSEYEEESDADTEDAAEDGQDVGSDGDDAGDACADDIAPAPSGAREAGHAPSGAANLRRKRASSTQPERRTIGLPSAFGRAVCVEQGLVDLVHQELELRKGQAHDAIGNVRNHIGRKSVLYKEAVRPAKHSQQASAAARRLVDLQTAQVNIHRLYYSRARDAMLALADNPDVVKEYEVMTADDLQSSTAELNPAARGLRHKGLSWFWYLDIKKAVGSDDGPRLMKEFARLEWTHARCRLDRAEEELIFLRHEMSWIPAGFEAEAAKWRRRQTCITENVYVGHAEYARRQVEIWEKLSARAQAEFGKELVKSPPPDINLGLDVEGNITWDQHTGLGVTGTKLL